LLLGKQDAHRTHFLLDGSQRRDERSKSKLVLGHESADVVDVLSLAVVVLDVVLDVLKPHVEDPQDALD